MIKKLQIKINWSKSNNCQKLEFYYGRNLKREYIQEVKTGISNINRIYQDK